MNDTRSPDQAQAEAAWEASKDDVGRAIHDDMKATLLAQGYADHPFAPSSLTLVWTCRVVDGCDKGQELHAAIMVPWEEMKAPERHAITQHAGAAYRMGYLKGRRSVFDEIRAYMGVGKDSLVGRGVALGTDVTDHAFEGEAPVCVQPVNASGRLCALRESFHADRGHSFRSSQAEGYIALCQHPVDEGEGAAGPDGGDVCGRPEDEHAME